MDLAVEQMKKFIVKTYGKKGQDVVDKNYAAVDRGGELQARCRSVMGNLPEGCARSKNNAPEFISNIVRPINAQDGDLLKVSDFNGIEDGTSGSSRPPAMGEARRGQFRSRMDRGQLHTVQQVRLCLSSRCNPSVCSRREGDGWRTYRRGRFTARYRQDFHRHALRPGCRCARLFGCRQLCRRMSGQEGVRRLS